MPKLKRSLQLYLVTHRSLQTPLDAFLETIREAVIGGVSLVQLREKTCSHEERVQIGKLVKQILEHFNVPLIINDDVLAAKKIGAHGVHLGKSDGSVSYARRWLGKSAWIGLSVENGEQALRANLEPLDYIAVSPVFSTQTKHDAAKPVGLLGFRKIKHISRFPLCAIGGVSLENIDSLMCAGADGVAVVSAIFQSADVRATARELYQKVTQGFRGFS